jgi:sugar phosphate isomerase/epimerase
MDIKISCAEYTFPLLPQDVCLRLIAGLGIRAVDISVFLGGPFITAEEVLQDPKAPAARLRNLLTENDLVVADVFPSYASTWDELAINSPDKAQRDRQRREFYRFIEFALLIDAPGMTLMPGVAWSEESLEDSLQRDADELQWRIELARSFGIQISVEPHAGSIIDTPDRMARLLELAPDLTLTLDYAHFIYAGVTEDELEVFIPRSRHIHCRPAAPGVMQARVYEGTIDFERLVRAGAAAGYKGYYGLEYVWIDGWDCKRVDNLSETVLLRDRLLKAAEAL